MNDSIGGRHTHGQIAGQDPSNSANTDGTTEEAAAAWQPEETARSAPAERVETVLQAQEADPTNDVLQFAEEKPITDDVNNVQNEDKLNAAWTDTTQPRALQCTKVQEGLEMAEDLPKKSIEKAAEAFKRVLAAEQKALAKLKDANGNLPMKYEQSPKNMSLEEFIRATYLETGLLAKGVRRKDISVWDDKFIRCVINHEQRNGPLPRELQIPKESSGRPASKKRQEDQPDDPRPEV